MTSQEFIQKLTVILEGDPDAEELSLLRVQVAVARSEALQELWEQRAKTLVPKDTQWTELDRRVMLEGFTAEKEAEYSLLLSLDDILADFLKTMAAGR